MSVSLKINKSGTLTCECNAFRQTCRSILKMKSFPLVPPEVDLPADD